MIDKFKYSYALWIRKCISIKFNFLILTLCFCYIREYPFPWEVSIKSIGGRVKYLNISNFKWREKEKGKESGKERRREKGRGKWANIYRIVESE